MPTATLRFFASLREKLAMDVQVIELSNNLSVAEAYRQLTGGTLPANTLTAINNEYVSAATIVNADDEVAYFPPVTGG